jgi:DNA polymerase III sliding clamp (beta) subunit (PCNA family)
MDLALDSKTLSDALKLVRRIIDPRCSLAALRSVLLKAGGEGSPDDGFLQIVATDIDTTVRTSIAARVERGGRITVELAPLLKVISSCPSKTASIEVDPDGTMKITADAISQTLPTYPPEEWPTVPSYLDIPLEACTQLDGDEFEAALRAVRCSVGKTKSIYTGYVCVRKSGFTATEGHRLMVFQTGVFAGVLREAAMEGVLLPEEAIGVLRAALKPSSLPKAKKGWKPPAPPCFARIVCYGETNKDPQPTFSYLLVRAGNTQVCVKLGDGGETGIGTFPDTSSFIAEANKPTARLEVDTRRLLQVLKLAATSSTTSYAKFPAVRLTQSNGTLGITSAEALWKFDAKVPVNKVQGDWVEICVDAQNLIEGLSAAFADEETVQIGAISALDPLHIVKDNRIFIVSACRIE